jgi:polar amino acid transport system substrate-binding protein
MRQPHGTSRRQACAAAALALAAGSSRSDELPELLGLAGDATYPFNRVVEGRLEGLAVDIAHEMARRAGYRLNLSTTPFRQLVERARTAPNLLAFTLARTPERESLYEWIGPFAARDVWLWKLKRRTDVQVEKLADVTSYSVGVPFGDASIGALEALGLVHKQNLHVVHERRSMDRMLRAKRFDLVPLIRSSEGKLTADGDLPEELLEPMVQLSNSGGYCFVMAKGSDPALMSRLRDSLAQMESDGSLARLRQRWPVK